jgi:hypothetical protein
MTIWRIRIKCWIPKVKNTHSEYAIFIAFPLQQWFHERAAVLRCIYIAYLCKICLKTFQKEGPKKPSKNERDTLASNGY